MKLFKYARQTAILSGIAFSLALMTGCSKDDDIVEEEVDNTVAGIAIASDDFSLLESALTRANLVGALQGTGPFTVFAPDNDAFGASGLDQAALGSLPVATLESILTYHVLTSEIPSGSVPAGPNAKVTTLSGDSVFVTRNSSGVYINGTMVKTADVDASNGIIHVLSGVLMPPGDNDIVDVVVGDDDLSYLEAAVLRASEGDVNVAQVLSTTNAITVFAPTNQAFINAGFATIADIQAADPAVLLPILTYHVVPARAFSSDLSEGMMAPTVNGQQLTISLSGGATVEGADNDSPSAITAVNIMAKNGVIHKIDQVLMPVM